MLGILNNMTYKQFKQYMDNIKAVDKYSQSLNEVLNSLSNHGLNFFSMDKWITDIIGLLQITMRDEFSTIDYFIYEIEWGKKGKDCITEKDGTKTSLRNYRELYKYLNYNKE